MMAEKKLTPKQRAFADLYLKTGNASEAARQAGYSPKTAFRSGQENMQKPAILQYIEARTKEIESHRIADAAEVMAFLSSAMRGEIKDQFGLDPQLSDRIDAAKQLQKRYGLDKVAVVGGEKDDSPVKTEPVVKVYLPSNGRDDDGA